MWNVGYLGDLRRLESLQRRWTREMAGVGELRYESRLRETGLYSIKGRLMRMDLIKVWKSFNAEIDVGLSRMFERARYGGTRGHRYKLDVPACRGELKRRMFAVRSVRMWNALPADVVEASNLDSFKRGVDSFLGDLLYATV